MQTRTFNILMGAFRPLVMLMALTAFSSSAWCVNISGYSNYSNGVGVGTESDSTYFVLTPTTAVRNPVFLQSSILDALALPIAVATPTTTSLYVSNATGVTNHAAVFAPAEPASLVLVIQHRVPSNYRSGGELHLFVHASDTVTAYGISITADAYINQLDATTVTTKAAGTVVQFPTTANVQINDLTCTNSSAVFYPGALVTWKVTVAGTDAVTRQFLGGYFSYRPWGVLSELWPGEKGQGLAFLGHPQVPYDRGPEIRFSLDAATGLN